MAKNIRRYGWLVVVLGVCGLCLAPVHYNLEERMIGACFTGDGLTVTRLIWITGPNCRLDEGTTPIQAAAANGHVEIVKYLLQRGADPFARDIMGESAFDMAHDDQVKAVLREYAQEHDR
jgi:hypothetical protein